MFSCTTAQHIFCTNCTVCNWTVLTVITRKLPLHVQLHNSTTHFLYKLYILQLNCTYSNYTEAAATCSAAQQHNTFTVQTVESANELYLQKFHRNCCYIFSCTTAHKFSNDVIWSGMQQLVGIISVYGQSHEEIRYINFTLLTSSTVLQLSQW